MSNTYHHRGQRERHLGHDLWGKRPLAGHDYSAENKRRCRRLERKRFNQQDSKNLDVDLDEVYEMKINEYYEVFGDTSPEEEDIVSALDTGDER